MGARKSRGTLARRPLAAQPQWRPRQQRGSGNQLVHTRAQSRLGSACPTLRRLVLTPRTPCALLPGAPRFMHPTLNLHTPQSSMPHALDTSHPGHPIFCALMPRKPLIQDVPCLGDPSTSGNPTSDTTLLTSALCPRPPCVCPLSLAPTLTVLGAVLFHPPLSPVLCPLPQAYLPGSECPA